MSELESRQYCWNQDNSGARCLDMQDHPRHSSEGKSWEKQTQSDDIHDNAGGKALTKHGRVNGAMRSNP
jgi:hypothetical protein